ncbi:MAG: hypothetical protein DYG96_01555 [Chlorobi bacterium CHB2]|nr:hypothetical protein [Chlorobi bacterium CHB2]
MNRKPQPLTPATAQQIDAGSGVPAAGGSVVGGMASGNAPEGSVFDRHIESKNLSLIVDDILPSGSLLLFVGADVLNCFINYVELHAVIVELDPEEDERYISISNRFYTHFHEFGTVIHVVASSATHWWYFCYDLDASDCAIGRIYRDRCPLPNLIAWVRNTRLSGRYPLSEIDVRNLHGWRSFQ